LRRAIAGLATGIGSLPYLETGPALTIIKECLPQLPHWPQLPRRTAAEGFVQQFLGALKKQGALGADGKSFVDEHEDWPEILTNFFSLCLAAEAGDAAALAAFAPGEEAAAGFFAFRRELEAQTFPGAVAVKGQVVGPLTVGFQLTAAGGRPAYYEPQLRELIVKNLALAARWQAVTLKEGERPVLLFIDEPAVSVYGQSTYITVTREQVLADMGAIVAEIKGVGAGAGVHSCAAVDWSILMALDIDVLSFDAYAYFDSLLPYRRELTEFLARGGLLAWGIVPTSEAAWQEEAGSLVRRLHSYWRELAARGVPQGLLERQYLITPSCGTGILPVPLAERIYALTAAVARELWAAGGE
jgi:hypothetical protein